MSFSFCEGTDHSLPIIGNLRYSTLSTYSTVYSPSIKHMKYSTQNSVNQVQIKYSA